MATSGSLVGSAPIEFIRASTVQVNISDARPNTTVFPFFDGIRVDEFCTPYNTTRTALLNEGDPIVTNDNGEASLMFRIIGGRWRTGARDFYVTDAPSEAALNILGNTYGSARATYETRGTLERWQNTIVVSVPVYDDTPFIVFDPPPYSPPAHDPLAQSFFTYGQKGGCFVTSIDLFFQSKDPTIPVIVEIRALENGFPAKTNAYNPDAYVSMNAADVLISDDASLATNFKFPVPIYLEEDRDYCFVVESNSNKYNAWTSRLGERSLETQRIIFEQPYVGSLFKSQSNVTWTPEQFDDLKFVVYKAKFDTTASSDMTFIGKVDSVLALGTQFTTTAGSNKIIYTGIRQHGATAGSKFGVSCEVDGEYNGIPGNKLNGNFVVTRVIDSYVLEFQIEENATSTGPILFKGCISEIVIKNPGSGYSTAPTVTVSAPASGTTATATATLLDSGKLLSITVTSKGSGYSSNPTVIVDGGGGSGAVAVASAEASFTVTTNKPIHSFSPQIPHSIVNGTAMDVKIRSSSSSYATVAEVDAPLNRVTKFKTDNLVASRINESELMGNSNSFEMRVQMSSENENTSPTLDIRGGAAGIAYSNGINNQHASDDMNSSVATSGVVGYNLTSGGTGYTVAPTVTIIPAENERSQSIVAATATATIAGGIVTALTISPGSGYTVPPTIVISAPSAGTTATATSILNSLNSEVNTIGNAYSRYVTKILQLSTPSTDVKLLVSAYSTPDTSIDWYIRTSLASDSTSHIAGQWKILKCDVERNKSRKEGEFFEYEFYTNGLEPFDTYDLKCVLSSANKAIAPIVRNYRGIFVA